MFSIQVFFTFSDRPPGAPQKARLPVNANHKEGKLRADFAQAGEILKMHVPQQGGRNKGYAFITYVSFEGYERAKAWNATEYQGRLITVQNKAA